MKTFLVCLLLGAAISGVYYNALSGEFVFDDYLLIVNRSIFPQIAENPWLALSPAVLGYRPFRTLSYLLDYRLGGMNPWFFHLSNILYHWLTACLVFLVTIRLTRDIERSAAEESPTGREARCWRIALFVAFIWAIHPVQTDSVSYISGRRDIIGGLCLFLAFWGYLRFRAAPPVGSWRFGWLALSCLVYGLGILSKESVLVLPALCWFYDALREGVWMSLRRRWALYFIVLLGGFAVLWWFAGAWIEQLVFKFDWYGGSVIGNFATVTRIWLHYLSLMVYPITLSADYSYNAFPVSQSFLEPEVFLALAIIVSMGAAAWALSRWRSLIGYGAFWLLIAILPVSHLIPIKEIMAEHYLYVPLFGFALICGILFDAACGTIVGGGLWRGRALVVYGLAVVLLILAGARVVIRNRDWADEETLWTVTAQTMPRCARAHYNLAGVHLRQKRIGDAQREFTTVLAILPNHMNALVGLGEIAFEQKQYGQAFGYANQAVLINPHNFRVQYLLGWTYLAFKKLDEAEIYFRQAMKLRPRYLPIYTGLETVAKERGDAEMAARWAEKRHSLSQKRSPDSPSWD
ncbi:MAG: tetratricopeptide repeat protein [Candidatus Binatia bacterium]